MLACSFLNTFPSFFKFLVVCSFCICLKEVLKFLRLFKIIIQSSVLSVSLFFQILTAVFFFQVFVLFCVGWRGLLSFFESVCVVFLIKT